MKTLGLIGGGKDIGIVYLLETDLVTLERLAVDIGGIVEDLDHFNYKTTSSNYHLGKDGWSEAIIKYLL